MPALPWKQIKRHECDLSFLKTRLKRTSAELRYWQLENQYGGWEGCFRHRWNNKFWSLNWKNFEQTVGRSKRLFFFFVSRLQISNCVSSSPQLFEKLGYHSIILQIGRGVYEPEIIDRKGFSMKYYRYKDSIAGDIQRASLVISHAGKVNFQMLSN